MARRRTRRNPTSTATQIVVAVASAGTSALVAVLVTNYFTRKATLEKVEKGEIPLSPTATPTVKVPGAPAAPLPLPQLPPPKPPLVALAPSSLFQQYAPPPKCPAPGWHERSDGGCEPNL